MSKPDDFKFDSRVRSRFLRSRILSSAEVNRHLEELPDLEGEYEVMSDVSQPAVSPARSEVKEEPIVFDGIRRLQALSDATSSAARPVAAPPAAAPSSGLPAYREPEPRPLGTPLRSLMESEISGVGAGAVSAALGAMAAEARNAAGFGLPQMAQPPFVSPAAPPAAAPPAAAPPAAAPPAAAPPAAAPPAAAPLPAAVVSSEPDPSAPHTPQTLRSEGAPVPAVESGLAAETEAAAEEDEDEDEDDADDDDDVDDDDDDDEADEDAAESDEDEADDDDDDDDDADDDTDEEQE